MLSRQLRLRVASIALALVAAVGVHMVWFLFVNTATGQAIDRAAFEGALMGQSRWWQVGRPVLEIVSNTLIGVGAVAAVVVALMRRRAWLAVQALLVIVGANVSTQLVKDLYNRPRLLTGWTGHNSLPSGHTTVVAAASIALLLAVPRRWRGPVAVLGAVWTLLTGLSTLVGRWHRPADVVAALLVACFWGALACLFGSQHSLDPPLVIRSRTNAITGWVLAAIATVGALVALGALRQLSQLGSLPDGGTSLVADILAQGELTAYIGGIAAVVASVFGVFAALLWLRNATLKAVITPQYHDNSAFAGYGANRANVTEPLPTPVTVAGNGVIKGGDVTRKLVIVESPTKARKIASYLGPEYEVEASVGHIRDLPQPSELPAEMKKGPYGKFAVDVDNGFDPYYVVYPEKKSKVRELKALLKDADELYLATDEDREGEAIAWHLLQELKPKVPVHRMVFHEITKEAITKALHNTRDINTALVDAQETRRILDRLYGYEVSPVLWRKVRSGLSAGRVQSVATRLIVERERARMAFVPASYWDIIGTFTTDDVGADVAANSFTARLTALDGQKVATGREFDSLGQLKVSNVAHLDEAAALAITAGLADSGFAVENLEEKPYSRKPAAPFTTSTMQQEAGRKLRMNARTSMRVAQFLYENGYITYMRTDSSALSDEAISAARQQASELYGSDSVPPTPRTYANAAKGAQEAHEAIRPAGSNFRTPSEVAGELNSDQLRLYDLIWKRTIASQMTDAKGFTASVKLAATVGAAGGGYAGAEATFSASGTVITHRGFLAAYEEGRDNDGEGKETEREVRLPKLGLGQLLTTEQLEADGHSTTPPPRFSEASLVKTLEDLGIGRPSTYAATISTIQDRGYVTAAGQALVPTWLSFAVVKLLEDHFDWLVDYDFTAKMEADLDEIAGGDRDRRRWLEVFYFGDGSGREDRRGIKDRVENLPEIDAVAINSVPIGEGLQLRVGRYGPYVEDLNTKQSESDTPARASVPPDLAPDELTVARARELIAAGADDGRSLGIDPASGHEVVVKAGRFGPYVVEVLPEPVLDPGLSDAAKKKALAAQPKPRTASLFKDMAPETVSLDQALALMSLPRVVGIDPVSGDEITAQNGRFGPYLKKGTDSRTISSEPQLFTVTLEEALAIYAEPKRRGARGQAAPPLKELGLDPTSEKPIVIKDGRFGPYITDGETNRTVPRDISVETITAEQAIELLAEKRAAGPKPKRGSTRAAASKKPTTKKPAATASAKTATKKPVTKAAGSKGGAGGFEAMTVAQLRELATEKGLAPKASLKKAELVELLS